MPWPHARAYNVAAADMSAVKWGGRLTAGPSRRLDTRVRRAIGHIIWHNHALANPTRARGPVEGQFGPSSLGARRRHGHRHPGPQLDAPPTSAATELEGCNENLVLTRPDVIREIHDRLLSQPGADIVETNTFGGTPLVLAEYGLAEQTRR